jgi:Holliday junction resolvase RusA-like endonuclease
MNNIPENITTKSALKAYIREVILNEAKKKKKEDVAPQEDIDIDMDMSTEETPTDAMAPETSAEVDIDPKVKAIQDALNKALANAKALGDEKLVNQIGNTITMLVRTQVVGQQTM